MAGFFFGLALPVLATAAPDAPTTHRLVHVFVALCDNRHQGIVPTTAELGNGQKPATNLYWGAMYGIRTFLGRAPGWTTTAVVADASRPDILDRRAFLFGGDVTVVAEAYDGRAMAATLRDFLAAAAGTHRPSFRVGGTSLVAGGAADLVFFIGHNGLMDMPLETLGPLPARTELRPAGAVVLACKSSPYFDDLLRRLGCPPLVTTSGFMAPEAYTVAAIVRAWAEGGDGAAVHEAAARAYHQYQTCSLAAARRLFVTP